MIWILSVETQRVHRKIFIHYVFTSQNRSGGEKSEFFWVRISANEQQLDHIVIHEKLLAAKFFKALFVALVKPNYQAKVTQPWRWRRRQIIYSSIFLTSMKMQFETCNIWAGD